MPESEAAETNPNYQESKDLLSSGSHDPEAAAYTMNCQRCVQAFVLRWCHGYDVTAMPCDEAWNENRKRFEATGVDKKLINHTVGNLRVITRKLGVFTGYTDWYALIFNEMDVAKNLITAKDIEFEVGYSGTEDQFRWIKKRVKSDGPGACYIAAVSWKGTRTEAGHYSSHVFCIINDNGTVKCIDPQTGKECSEYFSRKQIKSNRTALFRADTCRLNGSIMKEIVKYE